MLDDVLFFRAITGLPFESSLIPGGSFWVELLDALLVLLRVELLLVPPFIGFFRPSSVVTSELKAMRGPDVLCCDVSVAPDMFCSFRACAYFETHYMLTVGEGLVVTFSAERSKEIVCLERLVRPPLQVGGSVVERS
jgi:hypothetical protein